MEQQMWEDDENTRNHGILLYEVMAYWNVGSERIKVSLLNFLLLQVLKKT